MNTFERALQVMITIVIIAFVLCAVVVVPVGESIYNDIQIRDKYIHELEEIVEQKCGSVGDVAGDAYVEYYNNK